MKCILVVMTVLLHYSRTMIHRSFFLSFYPWIDFVFLFVFFFFFVIKIVNLLSLRLFSHSLLPNYFHLPKLKLEEKALHETD